MIEKLDWWEMTFGGGRFVRMAANSWAQWFGESLEIVQFDSWELEAQFQSQKVNMGDVSKFRNPIYEGRKE